MPKLAFTDASAKFRRALASCSSSSPSLAYLQRLSDRLPQDSFGRRDYRNTDPQTRQTSVHLAALRGRADVVGWLLSEDLELSRVRCGALVLP